MRRWWRWCSGKVAVTIICWAMNIFISQICTSKWASKIAFYRINWNAAAGQRRLGRHWKLLWMKVLIKHFKESSLVPETMLRTQRIVVLFGQSHCIRAKVVVFGKMWFYSCKVVVFRQKWLYSTKSGCIRAKLVLFGQKCLHWNKVVVFGQKWLCSGKSECNRQKWFNLVKDVVFKQRESILAKWLYSGKVVVFEQSGCIRAKMVVFGQKWLYFGKK